MILKHTRKQLLSAFLGNLFEHYDTALFGLLSPFLAPLFFPHQDPIWALIMTFAIIPIGMVARPIGSIVFGYLGDHFGYKFAFSKTLIGMSIISILIAFIPTYHHAGIVAPVLLALSRALQNFFSAGENVGGALSILQDTSESRKDMVSSFYQASTMGGIILASAGVSFLCCMGLIEEWWRLLYIFGGITAYFGHALRKGIREEFDKPLNGLKIFSVRTLFEASKASIRACWQQKKVIALIAIAAGFSYATYTVALVLMNGFIPLITNITKEEMIHLNTFLLILDLVLLPLFGFLAHHFTRTKMMTASAFFAAISGMPLFWMLDGASLFTIILIRICFVVIGVWFSATFYSWSQKLVEAPHRYTIISMGNALGSQLFGGPTAAISLWLFHTTHHVSSAALYWILLALISGIWIAKEAAFQKTTLVEQTVV